MRKILISGLLVIGLLLSGSEGYGQSFKAFFSPVDTFNKARFWGLNGTAAVGYTGVVIGLSQVWYKQFPRTSFHLFNDAGEWNDMDKMGHLFTAYFESKWAMHAYRWTGLNRNQSVWGGIIAATVFQTTIEVLDGFSSEWGFSFPDIAFNTAGIGLMATQEWLWKEQRIILKFSSHRPNYSTSPIQAYNSEALTSEKIRADDLFGSSIFEALIKDYNGSTVWASFNLSSFIRKENSWMPAWLNVAVGYGAENLYGGYSNAWDDDDGNIFVLTKSEYPRYRQYFLSLDLDLTRIKTRHNALKFLFTVLNIVKVPAPTLEVNSRGGVKFYPIYF